MYRVRINPSVSIKTKPDGDYVLVSVQMETMEIKTGKIVNNKGSIDDEYGPYDSEEAQRVMLDQLKHIKATMKEVCVDTKNIDSLIALHEGGMRSQGLLN